MIMDADFYLIALMLVLGLPFQVVKVWSEPLSAPMAAQLLLLKPGERDRFVTECFKIKKCAKEDMGSFVWMSEHIKEQGQERFWFTYICTVDKSEAECPVDGGWSPWGAWDVCKSGCGMSVKSRHRACTNPNPERGGRHCSGQGTQVTSCKSLESCNVTHSTGAQAIDRSLAFMQPFHEADPVLEILCLKSHCSFEQVADIVTPQELANRYWSNLHCYKYLEGCPIDGGYSDWSHWSSCSSRCGEGLSFRSRHCDRPYPLNGGNPCEGPSLENQTCFDEDCGNTEGIFLSPWSPWSDCPVMCGEGTLTSFRRCRNSDRCPISSKESVSHLTKSHPCQKEMCDRKGFWGDWGLWSACTAMCGEGTRYRTRKCDSPHPIGFDQNCDGEGYEEKHCKHWEDFCRKDLAGTQKHSEWGIWSACSVTCDGGFRMRSRHCVGENASPCYGSVYDMSGCSFDVPCAVDGGWSQWSNWSTCSVTCGEGITDRFRFCNDPYPLFGGEPCIGESRQERQCTVQECPPNSPIWGTWIEWSPCSASCGGGEKTRKRDCGLNRALVDNGDCGGEFEQVSVCNIHECAVDGNWASWSDFTPCTTTCGEGKQSRERTCTDPAPLGNGQSCEGSGSDINNCFNQPCATYGAKTYIFDKSGFISYRPGAHPTKHTFIYLRFWPVSEKGTLFLKREEDWSERFILIRLMDSHVILHVTAGSAEAKIKSAHPVKLEAWNSLEVGVSGGYVWVRVNDANYNMTKMSADPPKDMDWDLSFHVGGALPNLIPHEEPAVGGFHGKIAKFRMNYHEYSLSESTEWQGGNVPYVTLNVGEEEADVESQLPEFSGNEHFSFSARNAEPDSSLSIELVIKPTSTDGILLNVLGANAGTFLIIFLKDLVPKMALSFGSGMLEADGPPLEMDKWSILDISVSGPVAELRVNKGPAAQVSSPEDGALFIMHSRIDVGGTTSAQKIIIAMSTKVSSSFVGYVYRVLVNGIVVKPHENALINNQGKVNSASATIAGNYREISEPAGSSIRLKCEYSHLSKNADEVRVRWLKGDKLLDIKDKMKLENNNAMHPLSSILHLHGLDEELEGLYSCQITYQHQTAILRAYGVSLFQPSHFLLDPDSLVEELIIAFVLIIFLAVILILILSCAPSIRKRSTFLQSVAKIFDSCKSSKSEKKGGSHKSGALLDEINATYDNFKSRVEKAKKEAKSGEINQALLDDINGTYDDFISRVSKARNDPHIDKALLREINKTYDKFIDRVQKGHRTKMLKDIDKMYDDFKRRSGEARGSKVNKDLLAAIAGTYDDFKEREEKQSLKMTLMKRIRGEKLESKVDQALLAEVNDLYDDFKRRTQKDKKKALMSEIRQSKGDSDTMSTNADQKLLDEINNTYGSFKEREDRERRRDDLMREVRGGRKSSSRQGSDGEDAHRPQHIQDLLKEVNETYEDFKMREEKGRRRDKLMREITGKQPVSTRPKINENLLREVDKTYDNFKERERRASRLSDADLQEHRSAIKKKSVTFSPKNSNRSMSESQGQSPHQPEIMERPEMRPLLSDELSSDESLSDNETLKERIYENIDYPILDDMYQHSVENLRKNANSNAIKSSGVERPERRMSVKEIAQKLSHTLPLPSPEKVSFSNLSAQSFSELSGSSSARLNLYPSKLQTPQDSFTQVSSLSTLDDHSPYPRAFPPRQKNQSSRSIIEPHVMQHQDQTINFVRDSSKNTFAPPPPPPPPPVDFLTSQPQVTPSPGQRENAHLTPFITSSMESSNTSSGGSYDHETNANNNKHSPHADSVTNTKPSATNLFTRRSSEFGITSFLQRQVAGDEASDDEAKPLLVKSNPHSTQETVTPIIQETGGLILSEEDYQDCEAE